MSSRIEAELEALEELADEDVQAILADVQAAIERVVDTNVDLEEPADLDRLRHVLPTEPRRARLVHAALPPPIADAIEYVSASERQSAHWRKSRERSDPAALSDAELKQRLRFIDAAASTRGMDGVVVTADGREVARAPMQIGEQLRGEQQREEPDVDEEKGQAIFRKILDRL